MKQTCSCTIILGRAPDSETDMLTVILRRAPDSETDMLTHNNTWKGAGQ